MSYNKKLADNRYLLLLIVSGIFIVINYFLIYISTGTFEGFNVSGHPIFYMVPFAFSTYICFLIVFLGSILFLWKKDLKFDFMLVSAAQVGVLVGAITIIVGMIWSYVEWGYFWQWEARQTITLIMWLAYVGLLIFREMMDVNDLERKALISSVYGIASVPSIPLSNYIVGALHPAPQQTALGEGLGMILMLNFVFIGTISIALIYMTYTVKKFDFTLKSIRKKKMDQI